MANKKISALTSASTPLAGTEVLPVVQSGATTQVSVDNLTAGRAVSAASLSLTTTPLSVANGGTGLASVTANQIPYGNGTSALQTSSALTYNGSVLNINNMTYTGLSPKVAVQQSADGDWRGMLFSAAATDSVAGFFYNGSSWSWQSTFLTTGADKPFSWGYEGNIKLNLDTTGNLYPGTDNTQSCGTSAKRWSVIYAGTGTINTSDARQKEQVENLSDAEKRVAIKIKQSIKKFKFSDAVKIKGDNARIHFGVLAQEVASIFQSEGLDASKYALFCYDKWDDVFIEHPAIEAKEAIMDADGNIIEPAQEAVDAWTEHLQVAGDSYGVRYEELLAFVISAL